MTYRLCLNNSDDDCDMSSPRDNKLSVIDVGGELLMSNYDSLSTHILAPPCFMEIRSEAIKNILNKTLRICVVVYVAVRIQTYINAWDLL